MSGFDKLAIAKAAIEILAPLARSTGKYHPAGALEPAHWALDKEGCHISLAEKVLLSPVDSSLSCLLDVWPAKERKVFSVSWEPDRPWVPPRVVCCKRGDWIDKLLKDAVVR